MSIYSLVLGSRVIRGEEERGLVETWLAQGVGRVALVVARCAGLALALLLLSFAITLVGLAGAAAGKDSLSPAGLLTANALVALVALLFFSLSMLLSQLLVSRRAAAGLTAAIMVPTYILANLSFVVDGLRPFRWISPFYYFDRSHPLLRDGAVDIGGTLALIGATVALAAASVVVFKVRDVGSSLIQVPDRTRPEERVSLHTYPQGLILSEIWKVTPLTLWWTLGIAAYTAFDTAITPAVVQGFRAVPSFAEVLARLHITTGSEELGFVSFAVFGFMPPFLAAMVINICARWASDQEERRTEVELATPVTFGQLQAARLVALFVAVVVSTAGAAASIVIAARWVGIDVSRGHLGDALLALIPAVLVVGVIGAALMPRLARAAVGILTAVVVEGFVIQVLAAVATLPDWLTNLSLLKAYGNPLTDGLNTGGLALLLVICAVAGVVVFAQRRAEVNLG
jgi:ABC-2 type transport system permease protein